MFETASSAMFVCSGWSVKTYGSYIDTGYISFFHHSFWFHLSAVFLSVVLCPFYVRKEPTGTMLCDVCCCHRSGPWESINRLNAVR